MSSRNLFFCFLLAFASSKALAADEVAGRVINNKKETLAGASVFWLGSTRGISTDQDGRFRISADNIGDKRLVVRFLGYLNDTVDVNDISFVEIVLKEPVALPEVVVKGQTDGVVISDYQAIKTEQITRLELTKAACCDLAGCFETQTTVQPQTTNVITNAKELRILGLSGVYNQVLIDGFPMIQGLSYTYGISSIPGTLVENIYVSKGANSVLQGYESISGQINVETREPDNTDKLLLNAYTNIFMEKHFNANHVFKIGKWSHLTGVHTILPANKTDRDDDGFLDLPMLTRYMLFSKWKYGNQNETGWNSRIGLRYLNEQRVGGQLSFNPDVHDGSNGVYGQKVRMSQPEIFSKTGYRFNENQALVLFVSTYLQQQQSLFGSVNYRASQQNLYANFQLEQGYAQHQLKAGISFRHFQLQEYISFNDTLLPRTYAGRYLRNENIPGIFAENTMYFFDGKITWIAGVRADQHNEFGMHITPRTLLKLDVADHTVLRANVGTGWRTVNVFSENINLLVSSRDVLFAEKLNPERALNYGINATHKFESADDTYSGYLSADFYRTEFFNQFFPDFDSQSTLAIIKNYKGTCISNGFQAELFLKLYRYFEVKTGYNFLDVYRGNGASKQLLPFNPRHKLLLSVSYKPPSDKYHIDINMHWYGKQRLPFTGQNPSEFRRPDFSIPYTVVNAQFTYNFGPVEVYAGCENIFDFRQRQPILSWRNPFGRYFDTSSVWGPTRGREWYLGIRFIRA